MSDICGLIGFFIVVIGISMMIFNRKAEKAREDDFVRWLDELDGRVDEDEGQRLKDVEALKHSAMLGQNCNKEVKK